ncbi:hypothetical protein AS9A_4085 [Hoyosella subflava DQS3-9A1]|uniref:Uncharacterized protein n=1 Tax=Hoyosella subflava (strain DSM 45089 / JCM 17490 / NBRC 109087 / DQS3-9A1) TaxID=443218 RepID=F6EJA4_HOYSD|nr:hypothetical protein AS9A_4085 [Hoyosella subflava DQS3-9A1]
MLLEEARGISEELIPRIPVPKEPEDQCDQRIACGKRHFVGPHFVRE